MTTIQTGDLYTALFEEASDILTGFKRAYRYDGESKPTYYYKTDKKGEFLPAAVTNLATFVSE